MDEMEAAPPTPATKKRVRKLAEHWTNERTEKLINEVESRDGTWNFLSKEYKDRNAREALWQEIAEIMELPRSEVSTKWNSLRCSFRAAFNKMGETKSGQGSTSSTANPIHASLKFLEPMMRSEAPTTSNLKHKSQIPSLGSASASEHSPEESSATPSTSGTKRRRYDNCHEDGYAKVVERCLETVTAATKSDAWDDVGQFVASNGRLWEASNPQHAHDFKSNIYEVVLTFQKGFTEVYPAEYLID
ncbi:uncharacterized protein [Eurosta solidaginis]|uniref:uncharacterized protein n=1 Tax=Eurosta solidaginis TaxID=178769 RepID=UPI003530B2FB